MEKCIDATASIRKSFGDGFRIANMYDLYIDPESDFAKGCLIGKTGKYATLEG